MARKINVKLILGKRSIMHTSYYRVVVYQALFQELCYTAGDAVDW